jgi:hypothetical protein
MTPPIQPSLSMSPRTPSRFPITGMISTLAPHEARFLRVPHPSFFGRGLSLQPAENGVRFLTFLPTCARCQENRRPHFQPGAAPFVSKGAVFDFSPRRSGSLHSQTSPSSFPSQPKKRPFFLIHLRALAKEETAQLPCFHTRPSSRAKNTGGGGTISPKIEPTSILRRPNRG